MPIKRISETKVTRDSGRTYQDSQRWLPDHQDEARHAECVVTHLDGRICIQKGDANTQAENHVNQQEDQCGAIIRLQNCFLCH